MNRYCKLATSRGGVSSIALFALSLAAAAPAQGAPQDDRYFSTVGRAGLMVTTEPQSQTVLALDSVSLTTGSPMITRRFDGVAFQAVGTGAAPAVRATAAFAGCSSSQVVLFGGVGPAGGAPFGDTWVWNGASWAQLAPAVAPTARYSPASAQLASGDAIVFGGQSATGAMLGDTWRFNGSTWTQLAIAGPSARAGASMCSDGQGGIILFGGSGATLLNDTWRFDGTSWQALSPSNPPSARAFAGMDVDMLPTLAGTARNDIVLFGGAGAGNGDVFRLRNGSWSTVPGISLTTPSTLVVAATDAVRDTIVVVDAVIPSTPAQTCGSSFTEFGVGCGCAMTLRGQSATTAIAPGSSGSTTLVLDVTGVPLNFVFVLLDPTAVAAVNGFAVPGFPGGCQRFVGTAAGVAGAVGAVLDAAGNGTVNVSVPNNPVFLGSRMNYQAADFAQVCVSNALELRVGN
ncbi:MAG: kelch repeat-containing protein [Planctomycetota bacterium]